jgi:integrase
MPAAETSRPPDDGCVNHRPEEDVMDSIPLLDRAGGRRSPATTSSFHRGVPPRNRGLRYPPDPPTVEEIIAVMRAVRDGHDGLRLRGVIVMLWRAGLRISEALSLNETDLDWDRGAVLVRHGKGDKRREVGMDRWAWAQLEPWLELRRRLPAGALFCVVRGPAADRALPLACAVSFTALLRRPVCAVGSRRISCATRMR